MTSRKNDDDTSALSSRPAGRRAPAGWALSAMSLLPGEERTLSAIEDRLRKTDLWLAVKFTLFAGLAFCRRGPIRELVSPWQSSRRRTQRAILAVLLLALAFCAVMALLTGGVI